MVVLHPDFLHDPSKYALAASLWQSEWSQLVLSAGVEHEWDSPWLKTTFANGTPFLDGNPIFSAVSRTMRRGIRVIQQEPDGAEEGLLFWVDTFARGQPDAVKELVITCVLTSEILHKIVALMKQWVRHGEIEYTIAPEVALSSGKVFPARNVIQFAGSSRRGRTSKIERELAEC